MSRFEKLYNYLLENGELRMVPKMKGNWEQDKEKFITYQIKIEELANLKDTNFE